jgi:preprotein translocase subunit SecF
MQLFPIGKVYDFMGPRRIFIGVSVFLVIASVVLLFFPGPKLGTDFVGGTEVELAFNGSVSAQDVRVAVESGDFSRPDVIRVEDEKNPYRFLVRVQEVSSISEVQQDEIRKRLCFAEKQPEGCEHHASEVKISPGGEKITIRFEAPPDLGWVTTQLSGLEGIRIRPGENNPSLQDVRDHRVEVALMGRGDQLMELLRVKLGPDVVPEHALRTEWIGPKAGAQLRDAAIKSVIITLVFIMAYVAFRFDLRFAPGGVLALVHDSVVTLGILTVLGRELNLTTVAAILTIIGYSVNDTVVVYDRVRENLGKLRGTSFAKLINVSISEMLSRTILTSGTTIMVLVCFFIWGTGALQDFALTLIIGMVLGTYSSIYVALPLTDYFDRKFFASAKGRA